MPRIELMFMCSCGSAARASRGTQMNAPSPVALLSRWRRENPLVRDMSPPAYPNNCIIPSCAEKIELMSAFGTSGHAGRAPQCLLLGVKQTLNGRAAMSANDPKRTLASPKSRNGCYGISDHGCLGYSGLMLAAQIGYPRRHRGIGEARIDFPVERVDDFRRRVLGCTEAKPPARLVARHEFTHRRDVRQRHRARRGGDRQGAQLTCPDVLHRRGNALKHDLHLSAEQIDKRGCAAAIMHLDQIDAGHRLEQLTVNMWWTPDASIRHIDLARILLGIGNELGNRLSRKGWLHHHHISCAHHARDRCDVADKIEIEVVVEYRVDCVRRADLEERIAVRKRSHDEFGADIAGGARPVVDDE